MRVITARNVHAALPMGLRLLKEEGIRRESRNSGSLGAVTVAPSAVSTVYQRPWERVLFWPERDANPFLHLYEALWMLCGRNDIAPLVRYAAQFAQYSDDGVTQHAAYGHRWRQHFGIDQIQVVVDRLKKSTTDRRAVIVMWDPRADVDRVSVSAANHHHEVGGGFMWSGHEHKDVPCNMAITFQITDGGVLEMVVFCRSNDIVFGAYGANAVHLSVLHEHVARRVGVTMGTYTQISVNFHAYDGNVGKCWPLADLAPQPPFTDALCPYSSGNVEPLPIGYEPGLLEDLVGAADEGRLLTPRLHWAKVASAVLHAHNTYKKHEGEAGCLLAMADLNDQEMQMRTRFDWSVAAHDWLERRWRKIIAKQGER